LLPIDTYLNYISFIRDDTDIQNFSEAENVLKIEKLKNSKPHEEAEIRQN
jgi:hypothetical protein